MSTFIPTLCVHTTIFVLALSAQGYQSKCIFVILCNDLVCVLFMYFCLAAGLMPPVYQHSYNFTFHSFTSFVTTCVVKHNIITCSAK